jgi:sugar lactone lactonase YvrE
MQSMSRGWVLVAVVAACGPNKAHVDAAIDGPSDGPSTIDAPLACALPPTTTHVFTLSGCDIAGTTNGPRGVALFSNPVNLVLGGSGVAYVADFDSNRIRKVDTLGSVTTLVHRTDLTRPFGLALATDGTLYVETDDDDMGNHSVMSGTVWKVNPATGDATVIVRDIGRPRGLAVLPNGQIAMADYMHHVVALLDPTTGTVTPLAGLADTTGHVNATGSMALFSQPWDVAVLPGGDLAVSDFDNHVIRRVTQGGVVTDYAGTPGVAGSFDGTLANATFNQPKGLAVDASGGLYVTESGNHDVRRVAAGGVGRLAGSLAAGWLDSDTPMSAQFYGVEGLDVSPDGTRVVVADGNVGDGMAFNHVRVIRP